MAESLNATFLVPENRTNDHVFSEDSLAVGDSTRSLLTPLYASDYESISRSSLSSSSSSIDSSDTEASSGSSSTSYEKFNKRYTTSAKPFRKNDRVKHGIGKKYVQDSKRPKSVIVHPQKNVLTKSWEEWVIDKAIDDLKKLQVQRETIQKKKEEENRKREKKRRRELQEEENRKKWIAEKNYEHEKRKKEKAAQKEYEKLRKKQERELIELKSKAAYEKWSKEKEEKTKDQILKEKQTMLERREKEIERRVSCKLAYENWLRKTKKEENKRVRNASRDDYFEKLTGSMPGYVNPEPWKGVIDKSKFKRPERVREKGLYQSPPLLWKDYEKRIKKCTIKTK